jgi:hypothetical protein
VTFEQRVDAVADFGFTSRQAAFLTTVMLHAGVCLPRQYTTFCGIAFGHTTRALFATLTAQGFATAHRCWRRGGTFYHVHHKGLYRAIGEADNRHRRRFTMPRAVERLMLLDVVLGQTDVTWLATEREKVQYFVREHQCDHGDLPFLRFGEGSRQTVRYFTDKLPIGRGPHDREVVFVYLVANPQTEPFRRFLSRHHRVFHRVRRWTLQVVFPWFLGASQERFERAARELFAEPLRLAIVDEFRWYCEQRRLVEQARMPVPITIRERYARAQRAFGERRLTDTYHRWVEGGNATLNDLLSPLLREAWQRGDVRVIPQILSHGYLNLARSVITR